MKNTEKILAEVIGREVLDVVLKKYALEAMRLCSMEFAEWRSINAFQWGRLWRLYDEENSKNYTTAELFKIWEESK